MPHSTPAPFSETSPGASRRKVLTTVAWSTPAIAFAAAAPAMAASPANQQFAVEFSNIAGSNGYLEQSFMNLGTTASVGTITLTQPITIRFDVVGLLPEATAVRDFDAITSYGTLTEGSFDVRTQTVPFTWTIPAGTRISPLSSSSNVADVSFNWRDGASSAGRITNKVVVRSISGGRIATPSTLPIDSSVIGDRNGRDGIY